MASILPPPAGSSQTSIESSPQSPAQGTGSELSLTTTGTTSGGRDDFLESTRRQNGCLVAQEGGSSGGGQQPLPPSGYYQQVPPEQPAQQPLPPGYYQQLPPSAQTGLLPEQLLPYQRWFENFETLLERSKNSRSLSTQELRALTASSIMVRDEQRDTSPETGKPRSSYGSGVFVGSNVDATTGAMTGYFLTAEHTVTTDGTPIWVRGLNYDERKAEVVSVPGLNDQDDIMLLSVTVPQADKGFFDGLVAPPLLDRPTSRSGSSGPRIVLGGFSPLTGNISATGGLNSPVAERGMLAFVEDREVFIANHREIQDGMGNVPILSDGKYDPNELGRYMRRALIVDPQGTVSLTPEQVQDGAGDLHRVHRVTGGTVIPSQSGGPAFGWDGNTFGLFGINQSGKNPVRGQPAESFITPLPEELRNFLRERGL
jgi:hypothetical protein